MLTKLLRAFNKREYVLYLHMTQIFKLLVALGHFLLHYSTIKGLQKEHFYRENTLMTKHVQRVRANMAGFLRFVHILLTRSSLQTGSEWQGGTELPQSTGSHGSKQTGMANTNTNTTASLHWNVATPALKLAGVREQWIHNEDTNEANDTDRVTQQMI